MENNTNADRFLRESEAIRSAHNKQRQKIGDVAMIFSAKRCGTCKHFMQSHPFSECRRYPIMTTPLLIGVGPPSAQAPNGTPIMHLDVRYPVTSTDTPACGEWHLRIEIAHDVGEVATMPIPGNSGSEH